MALTLYGKKLKDYLAIYKKTGTQYNTYLSTKPKAKAHGSPFTAALHEKVLYEAAPTLSITANDATATRVGGTGQFTFTQTGTTSVSTPIRFNITGTENVQEATITTVAGTAIAEVDRFTFPTKASVINGDFFTFYYDTTHYAAVWLDTIGNGATGLPSGTIYTAATVKISVDISGQTSAAQVATAVYTALGLNSTITTACNLANGTSARVDITNKLLGAVGGAPNIHDKLEATAGTVTFARFSTGLASNYSGKYFLVTVGASNYYAWYNVTGLLTASVDPAPVGKTAIQITIAGGASANTIAIATASALDAKSDIISPVPAAAVVTVDASTDITLTLTDGNTLLTISEGLPYDLTPQAGCTASVTGTILTFTFPATTTASKTLTFTPNVAGLSMGAGTYTLTLADYTDTNTPYLITATPGANTGTIVIS